MGKISQFQSVSGHDRILLDLADLLRLLQNSSGFVLKGCFARNSYSLLSLFWPKLFI